MISDSIKSRISDIEELKNYTSNEKGKQKSNSWFTKLLEKKARKKVELSLYQKLKLNFKEFNQALDNYSKTKGIKDDYKRDIYDKKLDQIQLDSNVLFSEIKKDHLNRN